MMKQQKKTTIGAMRLSVFAVAFVVGLMHTFYVRTIYFSLTVGGYFLTATILFIIGAFACLISGRLSRLAVPGLFALSIIDCGLIYATRTFPTPFFGGRVIPWSSSWMPPGAIQVFIAQVVLIILTAYVLASK
jgi:hypothetical protein